MSADYEAIIRRYRPRGWTVRYSKRKDGYVENTREYLLSRGNLLRRPAAEAKTLAVAFPDMKKIVSCHPADPYTLHALLHEFAHVRLEHWGRGMSTTHREEFEADMYALNLLRLEGISAPREVIRGIKRYTMLSILDDKKLGLPIDPHVARTVASYWPKRWPDWVREKEYPV